jgi:S-formylglutathione hydrolase
MKMIHGRAFSVVAAMILAVPLYAEVIEVTVPAPSLAGNLLGDPAEQETAIYLPRGYQTETSKRYPAVYLLHGIGDTHDVWLQHFRVPQLLDALISSGDIPPIIVVMPNGRNFYSGSFYANSSVAGRWEDFIAVDLVGYVDRRYRTLARADARGVVGHSMGGLGAITLGMHRPEIFQAVYAMSPCCLAPVEDIGYGNPAWHQAATATSAEQLFSAAQKGDFYPLAIVALLAVMTPNPDKPPLFVDFPIRRERGELIPNEPLFTQFSDRFPINQIDEFRDNLRKLRALRLDYGMNDQFAHIVVGSRQFSEKLAEARVPHAMEIYAGDHRQQVTDRLSRIVFPFFGENLRSE